MLSTCLALVKPVGMSAEDAQAWLRVAAGEVSHLPPDMLAQGCAEARRTCTYHGQIIPAIIKATEEWFAAAKKNAEFETRQKERQAIPFQEPERWKPTPNELDRIKAEAAKALKAN